LMPQNRLKQYEDRQKQGLPSFQNPYIWLFK